MILDTILGEKEIEVAGRKSEVPEVELIGRISDTAQPRDFISVLKRDTSDIPAVIAEIKKASPSKGVIRADFEPVAIAQTYESAGASAISVLTDEKFFQGSLRYLESVKQAVSIPVLRKDFIIDSYQLLEARASGADAVLLIVAAMGAEKLKELMERARELDLQTLVEVHNEAEAETALLCGATLIGVNNRDLRTFKVSLSTTEKISPILGNATKVSESGISSREDMIKLGAMGVDAVLIGEALMREDDIAAKVAELIK